MENKKESVLIIAVKKRERIILGQIFQEQYRIYNANNGTDAVKLINQRKKEISFIIADFGMTVLDGYRLMEYMKGTDLFRDIPLGIIADTNAQESVFEFYKPNVHLKNFFPKKNLQYAVEKETFEDKYIHLTKVLCDMIVYRNIESEKHIKYVQGYTKILAGHYANLYKNSKMTDKKINYIVHAAGIHDIGKITMPDSILSHMGNLSIWESEILKEHTINGGKLIEAMLEFVDKDFCRIAYNVCMYHHEKYDGSGYPGGIRRDRIPIEAQIVELADLYDTLLHSDIRNIEYVEHDAYLVLMSGKCGELSPRMKECLKAAKEDLEDFQILD